MFFKLVQKNSKRSRKENGLLFLSLIISIVAFYIILSLGNQDVFLFLKTMESDAVNRVLYLVPILYGLSLFLLFFLVHFAGKYQVSRRSHEFGMYLMMGMRRRKLFGMLLVEELWSSVVSLIMGIPIAVFISELISLITAKLVGLGITAHHFSFSPAAAVWTAVGYCVIRLTALALLSSGIARKDISQLLNETEEAKPIPQKTFAAFQLLIGTGMLIMAYSMAILGKTWTSLGFMIGTVILGVVGTLFLFRSISGFLELLLKGKGKKKGLDLFTFRQLQETVFLRAGTLAVSSLLILMALCCFGYGVAVNTASDKKQEHAVDYTIQGDNHAIKQELQTVGALNQMEALFPVKIRNLNAALENDQSFSITSLLQVAQKHQTGHGILAEIESFSDSTPELISLSGYNQVLTYAGQKPLKLSENQMALYHGPEFSNKGSDEIWKAILADQPEVKINGESYTLSQRLCKVNFIADRAVSIRYGFIVPDAEFNKLVKDEPTTYWNAVLKKELVEQNGLMQAISKVNTLLNKTSLVYESYLQGMGRQLFYTVASSYITIYLAVIFLVVANTVIGVQFLMQQRKTAKRYQILIRLGCYYDLLRQSARKQIRYYFLIPLAAAGVSSFFGVRSLFTGMLVPSMERNINQMIFIAMAMILFLCVIELFYIVVVMKLSDRNLLELLNTSRDSN